MSRQGVFVRVAVILVPAAIIGVAAFIFLGKDGFSPPTNTGSSFPEVTENDLSFVKDANVKKHLVAMSSQKKMRLRSYGTEETAQDPSASNYFEIDRSGPAVNIATWLEKSGQKDFELIHFNGIVYIKDYSDNIWWAQALSPDEVDDFFVSNQVAVPADVSQSMSAELHGSSFENLGTETCPGTTNLTCYKYKQPGLDPDPAYDRFFWFDTKDFLLRHEESGFGEFRSFNDYSYDNINISAPSPTKEVPKDRSIKLYYVGREGTPITPDYLEDLGVPNAEEYLRNLGL